MAQIFQTSVYEINGAACTTQVLAFPSAACMLQPYNGSNSSLYGVINVLPTGKTYASTLTITQLQTLANA